MKNPTLFDFDTVFEYFVILSPTLGIHVDVKNFKKMLNSMIRLNDENLHSKAHLSLFKTLKANPQDEELLSELRDAVKNVSNFVVDLNDTDVFHQGDHKRTIYLKVANPTEIVDLYEILVQKFRLKDKKITPHLTLAKNILTTDYLKISEEISDIKYSKSFPCEGLTVLRRERKGNEYVSKYKQVGFINFQSGLN